ncbi:hypothetical protein BRADI_3g20207v3 [Brachypodium distachyon]|uniref:ACT domain-containing protein ACR n=1 Tax=Brachypodium distachyon TaxID=15368 RepID=A0A2K2CYH9_BRADI|nr:hypothetical protein BRADI_3g20207v3 [Brachypodium distachyon]
MRRMEVCCAYFDPDYENLNERIYGTRVHVDNESCGRCTVVKVNSRNKQDLLLEVLEVLIDLELSITKCYVSSDGGWSLDVFHVKDQEGSKVYNKKAISYIEQAICTREARRFTVRGSNEFASRPDVAAHYTEIEMIGHNRPGIFSEISAVLAEEGCNVIEAHAWSHKDSLACVAFVSDESTSSPINDRNRLATIEDHLGTVLRSGTSMDDDQRSARAHLLGVDGLTSHPERRLHQLMFASRDFDGQPGQTCNLMSSMPQFLPRGLLPVRHKDGHMLDTADEKCLVVKGLKAAVERRTCEGVKLELCTEKKNVGFLSHITRVLRESGLTVTRADIAMDGDVTKNTFYVKDISGNKIDMNAVESVRRELEPLPFQVKDELLSPGLPEGNPASERNGFCILGMLKSKIERLSHGFIST